MTPQQFKQLCASALGQAEVPSAALIVDSPWIPGFVGIDSMEYFTEPDKWLKANLQVVETFPEVIFIPGFWLEYGMAIEPSAFGCKVSWWKDSPPSVSHMISDISQVRGLSSPLPANDGLMPLALHLQRWVQKEIAPLGLSIHMVAARGPLALAGHLRGITDFLTDIKVCPKESHVLLDVCTQTVIKWLRAQVENLPDVQGILVLDDIIGLMSPIDYEEFAHPYLERVFSVFNGMLKIYHNDANIDPFAERLAETGFDVLNFSHEIKIGDLNRRIGKKVALMGNVPPLHVLANGSPQEVSEWAKTCIKEGGRRLILSAGGGTSPGTPAENIRALALSSAKTN